jgi:hypothetical protein
MDACMYDTNTHKLTYDKTKANINVHPVNQQLVLHEGAIVFFFVELTTALGHHIRSK